MPKKKPGPTDETAEEETSQEDEDSKGRFRIHLFSRDEPIERGPRAGEINSCSYDMSFDGLCWSITRNGVGQWYYPKPEHAAQRLVELGVEHCESLEKLQAILDAHTKTLVKSLEAVAPKVPA